MKKAQDLNQLNNQAHEAVYEVDELRTCLGTTKAMNRNYNRQRPTPVSEKTGSSGPDALA